MSARFFKVLTGVFLVHLVMLYVVWVGFSAPFPRPPATFTYQGAFSAQNIPSGTMDEWQEDKGSDHFTYDHPDTSFLDHWARIRGPSK